MKNEFYIAHWLSNFHSSFYILHFIILNLTFMLC